ncbi:Uncharacterized protein TCM_037806 [Theobroma cacao]|uniref:Uncharacterized protein n=1 Tax=Theobroma cacao TaxID=3641 RepID=A0A061GLG6_THECC|nr:Uncharacterized protein TCM_037806 [Theobroma cacao]
MLSHPLSRLNIPKFLTGTHQTPPYHHICLHWHLLHHLPGFLEQPGSTKQINHAAIMLQGWPYPITILHHIKVKFPFLHLPTVHASAQHPNEGYMVRPHPNLSHAKKTIKRFLNMTMHCIANNHGRPRRNILFLHP